MREFWVASGHHLTRQRRDGWLEVTDEMVLAYLARPEVLPPEDACFAERALHARLTRAPRSALGPAEIAALADADARENWERLIGFRDRLLAAGSVEAAYLAIVRAGGEMTPLFLDHLAQLILRNALEGCDDPFVLRAGELFFRPQRARVVDGALRLADAELLDEIEAERAQYPLTAMFASENLDVMSAANAWTYWSRSDAHAMVMDFGGNARARQGLATAIAAFVRHLMRLEVEVEALVEATEPDLRWFVGLDAEATKIGNALWRGQAAATERLIGLFRLRFRDAVGVDPKLAGHPVYLLLATTPDGLVRVKPQNLVLGLPLAQEEATG